MDFFQVIGIALIGAIAAVLLRQSRPELGMMVSLAGGVILISLGLDVVRQAFSSVQGLLQRGGIEGEYAEILFKSLGICIIAQAGADACKDSGEKAIGAKVEFLGKLAVLTVSLPLFTRLLSIVTTLLDF